MTEQNQKLDQGITPSAFPSSGLEYTDKGKSWAQAGMTLRDYFAIRAFQTRLAKHNDWTLGELTDQAFRDADAMLRARTR
jgi:hypothetical protein